MNRKTIILASVLCLCSAMGHAAGSSAEAGKESAVKQEIKNHFKFYGFIRNYFTMDTRQSVAGTGDLFYHRPLDTDMNDYGQDLNEQTSFRFLALTTRLGVDVSGYSVGRTKFGAKVETDFYTGLSGSSGTAQLRLRQAYATVGWDDLPMGDGEKTASVTLKIGQAWHPLAADQPHVTSLETGAPFNAFSRTPLVLMDAALGDVLTVSAGAIWQMQYQSAGPSGNSANYIKYACTPEGYVGVSLKSGGFLGRVGASVLSIKPRRTGSDSQGVEVKVSDRITTVNPYVFVQYTGDKFQLKAKTIYSQAGEHLYLMSGYGVTDMSAPDGHWEYAPLQTSSTWASISYGKKWQVMLMGGYIKNLGAAEDFVNVDGVTSSDDFYFNSNGAKNLNSMWRVIPTIAYNIGKFTLALEYNLSAAQYGDGLTYNARGLSLQGLHWVYNHRVQTMFRFTF